MKLFLHIGTGKTGTTSIQHILSMNADKFLELGYYYPDIDRQRNRDIHNHNVLSIPVTGTIPREFYKRLGKNLPPAMRISRKKWNRLGKLITETQSANIILSSEYLFYARNPDRILSIIKKQIPTITDIQVICYLRDPVGFYVSNLQQTIKASGTIPLPHPPAYFEALKRWEEIGALSLRHFSKKSFIQSDLVTDFIHQLSPEISVNDLTIPPRRNESFSAEGMAILQEFRRHIFPKDDNVFMAESNLVLKYIRIVEEKFGKFDFFSRPTLRPEIENYIREQSQDNQKIFNRYGLDLGNGDVAGRSKATKLPSLEAISDIIHVDEAKKNILYHQLIALLVSEKVINKNFVEN